MLRVASLCRSRAGVGAGGITLISRLMSTAPIPTPASAGPAATAPAPPPLSPPSALAIDVHDGAAPSAEAQQQVHGHGHLPSDVDPIHDIDALLQVFPREYAVHHLELLQNLPTVKFLEHAMVDLHESTGLPWFGIIAGCTLGLRVRGICR